MLNRDINSRFEDWLLNPRESLDFEVKQWLDMTDAESQGLVAKALIALENHGGGFLLFGYKEDAQRKLVPDPIRPDSLEPYLSDALNSILKRRAEPSFHVEATLQRHPESGDEFPLVRVPGTSKVPVRSDSATSGGSLKQHVFYIRAPGPESRGPLNATEWDELLRRALSNQREEIVGLLRTYLTTASDLGQTTRTDDREPLLDFVGAANKRWRSLNDGLPVEHPAHITQGHYSFAARIVGKSKGISTRTIIDANSSARRYTGWPVFIVTYQDPTKPRLIDGCIEAWLAEANYPDVGHADFWRIDPAGNFFLLRGYQEDTLDPTRKLGDPATLFEATLPVWRLGEFLLRVTEIGDLMFDEDYEVLVECEWTGLAGRKLFVHNMRRMIGGGYVAAQPEVRTQGRFARRVLRDLLPEAVRTLTVPLYDHFDFFQPPDSFFTEELAEMTKNRF